MSDKKYTQQEMTDAFRSAIEDRAKWFYLLIKYARKENADIDKIAEQAITEFGEIKGKAIGSPKHAKDFAKAILTGHAKEAFEMKSIKLEKNESVIKFNYCPLVEAWKKLGCSSEEVAKLCDLARCGDYGMVKGFEHLELEFNQLLSKGDSCCEMVITKR